MKLAEENLWKKFLIIGYGHNLGDLTPKVQAIKEKIIISLYPNSKLFCTETNYQRGERQTMGWKKNLSNHICDKAVNTLPHIVFAQLTDIAWYPLVIFVAYFHNIILGYTFLLIQHLDFLYLITLLEFILNTTSSLLNSECFL